MVSPPGGGGASVGGWRCRRQLRAVMEAHGGVPNMIFAVLEVSTWEEGEGFSSGQGVSQEGREEGGKAEAVTRIFVIEGFSADNIALDPTLSKEPLHLLLPKHNA